MLRTIMILPQFDNEEIIHEIRKKYDPLYDLVKPHITLVFPFQDDMTNKELQIRLNSCLNGIRAFPLVLKGVTKQKDSYGNYLFLNVVKGTSEIIAIHNNLYSSIFGQKNSRPYIPHMTIGKLTSKSEMDHAYLEIKNLDAYFETLVTKISVEMIGEQNESIIIIEKNLK